jgi:uncharacterized membrane protein (UPF0127 family)
MGASGSNRRGILIFLGLAAVLILLYGWYSATKRGPVVVAPKVAEPQFVKEGMLSFTEGDGDTIRTINIEIADNMNERTRGLMYRSNMSDDQGMLFIFDREEEQSFWMKNTKISLDILYVNSQQEIITIYRHTQPYSESPIPSFKPARYVIEVKAGFCDAFGVEEGDRVVFERI